MNELLEIAKSRVGYWIGDNVPISLFSGVFLSGQSE
jgi:hypothetical protein